MRKFLLMILFLGLARLCFADVTAEIFFRDIDNNGNIRIWTQYKIDGTTIPSNYIFRDKIIYNIRNEKLGEYSNDNLNGMQLYCSRYSIQNFANMNATQVQARIDQDLKAFGEQLILKPFQEQLRIDLKTANENLFKGDLLKDIIGYKTTIKTATMVIDKDFDGIQDTEMICKTDGTKTEKPYTPTP